MNSVCLTADHMTLFFLFSIEMTSSYVIHSKIQNTVVFSHLQKVISQKDYFRFQFFCSSILVKNKNDSTIVIFCF